MIPQRKLDRPVSEIAESRLEELSLERQRVGRFYLSPKTKARQAWLAGFIVGARLQFTEDIGENAGKEDEP